MTWPAPYPRNCQLILNETAANLEIQQCYPETLVTPSCLRAPSHTIVAKCAKPAYPYGIERGIEVRSMRYLFWGPHVLETNPVWGLLAWLSQSSSCARLRNSTIPSLTEHVRGFSPALRAGGITITVKSDCYIYWEVTVPRHGELSSRRLRTDRCML